MLSLGLQSLKYSLSSALQRMLAVLASEHSKGKPRNLLCLPSAKGCLQMNALCEALKPSSLLIVIATEGYQMIIILQIMERAQRG